MSIFEVRSTPTMRSLMNKSKYQLASDYLMWLNHQAQWAWQPPETAPKDGKPFLITTAGPEVDLCVWVPGRHRFEDYYFKQPIPNEWPHMVAWKRLDGPAAVEDTEADSRDRNGFPARKAAA